MKSSRVVFCDFDGTITNEDTFVSVLEKFAPEAAEKLLPMVFNRQITLLEGIKQTIGSIPSIYYPQIIEYIAHRPVRSGLKELLDFLNDRDIPFVVISGGLIDIVRAVLEHQQLSDGVTEIYAGKVDSTGKYLRVYSDIESDTELVAKAIAMEKYPFQEKIAIGDSVTDINMSLAADLVFARDRLMGYLDTENKFYIRWNNFYEVRDYLAQHWQLDQETTSTKQTTVS